MRLAPFLTQLGLLVPLMWYHFDQDWPEPEVSEDPSRFSGLVAFVGRILQKRPTRES